MKTCSNPTSPTSSGRRAGGVKTLALVGLIVLNLALGLSLLGQFARPNTAEAATQVGRPSEYLMIPVRPVGLTQDVVAVLDTETGNLSVIGFDQGQGEIVFQPPLRLSQLFNQFGR